MECVDIPQSTGSALMADESASVSEPESSISLPIAPPIKLTPLESRIFLARTYYYTSVRKAVTTRDENTDTSFEFLAAAALAPESRPSLGDIFPNVFTGKNYLVSKQDG